MARQPKLPAYCHHGGSGQAYVRINGVFHYLGEHGSAASMTLYRQKVVEYLAGGNFLASHKDDPSVEYILAAYGSWAAGYYQKDGKPTKQFDRVKRAIVPVRQLYGQAKAREFGPLALQAVRQWMIEQGWCRRVINQRVECIKRCFKWAASQEILPATVYQALRTVDGLRQGRSAAPESVPVPPAPEAAIAGALAHLGEVLADIVRFQLLTGARPGEALAVHSSMLVQSGPVWSCRPASHKTAYRGKRRLLLIGPRAQEVLSRWLYWQCPRCGNDGLGVELGIRHGLCGPCADQVEELDIAGPWRLLSTSKEDHYLFSPRIATERLMAAKRAVRKSNVQPSQVKRGKRRLAAAHKRKKQPGERYLATSYARAVAKACERAGVEHWHPNQLRHNAATLLAAEFGIDIARQILGHSSAAMTEIYAEPDLSAAMQAILKVG
jgi:integrase